MSDSLRYGLIGSSLRFQQVRQQIQKVAQTDASVLIAGETGTGKELVARAIHYQGARCDQPFIPVNCAALPEALIESELFGHERGAFTDAKSAAPGLVHEANGGTLFLDEVDALSLKAQASMLRFLQDKTYRRVGSSAERHANVRILTASNAALEQLVEARQFRRDLLYRINVLMLRLPPLRERGDDILELAEVFLQRLMHQYRLPNRVFHPDTRAWLLQHDWPGNIRELENWVQREFLMSETDEIRVDHTVNQAPDAPVLCFKTAKANAISQFEQHFLQRLLQQSAGNLSKAARLAGQDRSTFGKLARKYGLQYAKTALEPDPE